MALTRHCDDDQTSDCQGELYLARQYWSRKKGCTDVWACTACDWDSDPRGRRRVRQAAERRTDGQTTGAKTMKIRIGANRKASTDGPGGHKTFGSYGSSIEFEVTLDDDITPAQAMDSALIWAAAAELAVQKDMDRKEAALAARAERQQPAGELDREHPDYEPAVEAPRNGRSNGRRWDPDSLPPANGYSDREDRYPVRQDRYPVRQADRDRDRDREPERDDRREERRPSGGPGRSDAPTSGKQLLGWANKTDRYGDLMALVKAWEIRSRVVDLGREDVDALYRELTLKSPRRN